METALKGRVGGHSADGNVVHVERGDTELGATGAVALMKERADVARAPEFERDEARQRRADRDPDGRADLAG